jgi:hypothetical protein
MEELVVSEGDLYFTAIKLYSCLIEEHLLYFPFVIRWEVGRSRERSAQLQPEGLDVN